MHVMQGTCMLKPHPTPTCRFGWLELPLKLTDAGANSVVLTYTSFHHGACSLEHPLENGVMNMMS